MGTRKKFVPKGLKHLRANPYTLWATPDSISYTLAFKKAFWALSLQGCTGTATFHELGYNTEVLGLEHIHTPPSAFGRQPSHRRGSTRSPVAACASQAVQGRQAHRETRPLGA